MSDTSTRALIIAVLLIVSCGTPSRPTPGLAPLVGQTFAEAAGQKRMSAAQCLAANGVAYGPFRDGQGPGDPLPFPSISNIDEDLGFVRKVTTHIRTYASSGMYSNILPLARKHGLKVMLGVRIIDDAAENEKEIKAAVALVGEDSAETNHVVESIVVGNETLSDSSSGSGTGSNRTADRSGAKSQLIAAIKEVKRGLGTVKVPVSTAQVFDVWESNLDLASDVDFVVAHFYPFWGGRSVDNAATTVLVDYQKLKGDLRAKYGREIPVVIGETGWPSGGASRDHAIPSPENQRRFVEQFLSSACDSTTKFYLFEMYDEEWKWQEGGSSEWTQLQGRPRLRGNQLPDNRMFTGQWIGAAWGLFDSNGRLKPNLDGLLEQPPLTSRVNRDIFVDGQLSGFYDMGVDSWPGHRHEWAHVDNGELQIMYPAKQTSGAVFITVGESTQPPRPWKDFSRFKALSLEMRGEKGGERVGVGIKNRSDSNNGNEKRLIETLDQRYRVYRIPLPMFASGHLRVPEGLTQLNVVTEFVFGGIDPQTIYIRTIRYERDE